MVVESPINYLNVRTTVASWLLTKDHKRIGLLYMVVVTLAPGARLTLLSTRYGERT